jgi:photosystem II stability/assembly factor-like uncharacterized protein
MKKYIHLLIASTLLLAFNFLKAQTPNWTLTGPNLFPVKTIGQVHGIGRISQFKFHPTDANKMYATSASGGLWYSANKGVMWSVMGTDKYNYSSASVAIDPTNDQVIYWGTGDANYYSSGSGVLKSTDGGQTFTLSNTGMGNKLVIDIIFLPTDNKTIIAATDGGIYKSTDAGANWVLKSASDQFQDICFKPGSNGQILFATAAKAYYRSLDAGNTWTKITSNAFLFGAWGTRVACPASNPNIVYVVNMGASDASEVYKSTDGGATFTSQRVSSTDKLTGYDKTSTGQGNYGFDIEVSPTNENELYICAHIIWRTTDGGKNWTQQQTGWWVDLHTDQHQLLFDPYVSGQLWNANDGGVFSNTTNGTGEWTNKSDGLACNEIYRAAMSNTSPDYAYIGTQDNGGFYYKQGTWYNDRGGDWGAEEFFDYRGNNVYDDEQASRTTIGRSSQNLNLPFTSGNTNKAKYAFTPANTTIGFVTASGKVYRCSNLNAATLSWTQIYTLPSGTVEDIEVDPGNADILYIINSGSNVYRSDNATSTATFTTLTLPQSTSGNGFLAPIKSTSVVYAAAGNKIYRSDDKGVTWTVTSGFPASNVNGLVADRFSTTEAIYASYNLGVYYKDNTKSSWVNYGNGLPIISDLTDLMIYNNASNQGLLRVSYYGRGMWESPLVSTYNNIAVNLTSPTNGATAVAPATLTLTATASATTGSITKVEFYNGTTLLATVTSSPYTYTWSNVPFGTYAITAVAYDNTTASKTSAVANVTVNLVCTKVTGTAFGTSPAYSVGSEFDKAFDGKINTYFDNNGSTGYTGLDFGTATTVYAVRFYPRVGNEGRMIGGIFQASNSSTFASGVVNLDTIEAVNGSTWNELGFPANTKYRYFRYVSPANGYCNVAEIEFCGTANQSPTVTLTSPTNNQVFASSPNSITISATATDTDGTISKVEFYQGNTLLNSVSISPYTYSWTNVADGTYSITAKAYDNLSAITTSTAVNIIVGNQNPTVSITSPQNNASFSQPANITINASATDPVGTISKVEFYNGATLLGTVNNTPYTFTWSGVTSGTYSLTAKAYDNKTGTATSSIVSVTVGNQAPIVFITSPTNNSSFGTPASITINALASDIDGTVSKVEFYNGATLLSSDATAPYLYTWTNVAIGNYTITAKAYDNGGATTTSTTVNISVNSGCSAAAWNASTTYLGDAGLGGTNGEVVSYNGHQYRAKYWTKGNTPGGAEWLDLGACSAPNQSPTVSITSPTNNAILQEGLPSDFTVNTTDADGSIASVKYYLGTTLVGISTVSPFTYTWTNPILGLYELTAVAFDNKGMSTTSSTINIEVKSTVTFVEYSKSEKEATLSVYPNPSTGIFMLSSSRVENTTCAYQIIDVSGNILVEKSLGLITEASIEVKVDASHLATGMYIVRLLKNGEVFTERLNIVSKPKIK